MIPHFGKCDGRIRWTIQDGIKRGMCQCGSHQEVALLRLVMAADLRKKPAPYKLDNDPD